MPKSANPASRPGPGAKKAGAAGAVAAAIALIITALFNVEGGYVNDPNDPGGETNRGVTEQVARDHGYRGRMQDLPEQTAKEIYADKYIHRPGYDEIVELDRHVAEEVIDAGVNAGPARASLWFQQSLNHLNRRGLDYADIAEDGIVGSASVSAFAALRRKRGARLACELLIKLLDAKQAQHYANLAARNSRFETFMIGWVRTRIGNVGPDKCGQGMPA